MKWSSKKPEQGSERIISRYLLIPLRLHGETRWLETARIKQRACGTSMMGEPPHPDSVKWIDMEFAADAPSPGEAGDAKGGE